CVINVYFSFIASLCLVTCPPPLLLETVVIVLILLSLAAFGFLLYRYLCRNKGAYRTTGELAPGEDPDQVYNDTVTPIKKEYFI
uniref:Uncharacterized protein n=1 Tax=Denticeps clupeoides TaxID=299321 RepID=A0AAY4CT80_9TELE